MTLLITSIAAVVAIILWYTSPKARQLGVGVLCLQYGGAALMWLVDAVFAYVQEPATFFSPSAQQMGNDAFLGAAVVALGLVVWACLLLVRDPGKVFRGRDPKKSASSH